MMGNTAVTEPSRPRPRRGLGRRLAAAGLAALLLAGCQADELGYGPKSERTVGRETREQIAKLDMSTTSPVLMRIFKEENTFEVWKKAKSGRYELLKTYEICSWSGKLGPKIKEGDRQAPEGYYTITPALMNPNSNYYLAFNTGYPNAFDRSHGRTGSHLMVHGACSSRGCYAMTDAQIQEIYALARDAFRGGQRAFQLQAYPFRMTPENMARHWGDPSMPFWKMLKEGYDTFELTRQEPKVDVCGRKYVFNATPKAGAMSPVAACPELERPEGLVLALNQKAEADEAKAIVIAAKIDADRKAEEERVIMVAMQAEEARKRAAEREIAVAERKEAIVAFLGIAGSADDEGVPVIDPAVLAAAAAGTSPMPRPNPRGPNPMLAMAGTASQQAANKTMFSRLFSFGDDPVPAPPAPIVSATAEPTAGAPAAPATVRADVPTTATLGAPRPGVSRPILPPAAAPAQPTTVAAPSVAATVSPQSPTVAGPACAVPGSVAANGLPACPVVSAAEPVPADDPGILDRIGNWF